MNRYMIVIPAKNRSFLLKCDEGDGMKLETLQKLVSGYVETVPSALDATWAREEADRLVLLVDEEGRLKCKAANQRATNIAPADVTWNGMQPLVGAAVLALQRGDKLMGICPKTVRRMCQRGELPAHKEGPKLWRIDKNAALEQRQEAMEICQRNARKAPKNKKPAGAGTPTSLRVTG